LSLHLVRF